MQGFVVVGFAIVAVGLALNKLWDLLFYGGEIFSFGTCS
jgi:hypothetical protein